MNITTRMRKMISVSCRTSQRQFATTSGTLPDIESGSIIIDKTKSPRQKVPYKELKFGQTFSDHMLEIDWTNNGGWGEPKISPFRYFNFHPAVSSLHYGLQAFEGMKAYIGVDGKARLFRPLMNMARMNSSCEALCMPTFDQKEMVECLKALVRMDKDWIPTEKGYSLYIRPTIISTDETLGVAPPKNVKIFVITCPVGPYYPTGFAPVTLYADPKYVRAWPGGCGDVKAGGNYGPTIRCQLEAAAMGCQQVLWLFGEELEVTEVGTMNQFFVWINEAGEKEVVTAPLDGTILPGVTRDSMLAMLREEGEYKVTERIYTLKEIMKAIEEGRMIEAFGSGTAAIVSPVKGFMYKEKMYDIPLDKNDPKASSGPLTKHLFERLLRIQYGEEPHEWSVIVD